MEHDQQGGTARERAAGGRPTSGPPLGRQLAVAAAVVAAAVTLLGFFGVAGAVIEVPFKVFTKEIAEQFDAASYTGALAHITWFLWVVAGTAGVLAAEVLRRRGVHDRRVPFFLGTSALTALLLLDDFAMLHEQWLPKAGMPEEALYLAFAAGLVVLLIWFRPQFVHGGVLLAVLAGAFWAASLGMDVVQEQWEIHAHAVEDGAKLVGTALWAAFMVWSSLAAMDGASRRTTPPDDPAGA